MNHTLLGTHEHKLHFNTKAPRHAKEIPQYSDNKPLYLGILVLEQIVNKSIRRASR